MGMSSPYIQYNINTPTNYKDNFNLELAFSIYLCIVAAIFLFRLPNRYSIENGSCNFKVLRASNITFLSSFRIGHYQKI